MLNDWLVELFEEGDGSGIEDEVYGATSLLNLLVSEYVFWFNLSIQSAFVPINVLVIKFEMQSVVWVINELVGNTLIWPNEIIGL